MLNLLKMDLYRLFRSSTTWIMLLVTVGMAVFGVSMTKYDASNMEQGADSMATEIGADVSDDGVNLNFGISATTLPEWATGDVDFADLVNTQVGSGLFLIVVSIFVTLFVCAEHKNGYIKNIAGQFPNRGVLIVSKAVAIGAQVLAMFLVLFVTMFVTGKICFGDKLVLNSVGKLFTVLGGQFVLHYAFAGVILCLGVLFRSSALSMTIGILISCKLTSLLYMLGNKFSLDLTRYALETNVTRFSMITDRKEILVMMLSAAVIFAVTIGTSIIVMQKRDVR
ncbi:MAG: hypothetical protein E7268_02525 [Lachnospiraceae bacterium]|nr:hypothetical protein [Lachnospiraceae bacterium]